MSNPRQAFLTSIGFKTVQSKPTCLRFEISGARYGEIDACAKDDCIIGRIVEVEDASLCHASSPWGRRTVRATAEVSPRAASGI
jgi:hypothetical protein